MTSYRAFHVSSNRALASFASSCLLSLGLFGCDDPIEPSETVQAARPDAGAPDELPEAPDAPDSGAPELPEVPELTPDAGPVVNDDPLLEGAPAVNTAFADHELDIFGVMGNRYWFAVTPEQVDLMNTRAGFGDGGGGFFGFGDIYTPGDSGDETHADHLVVTTAGAQGRTADYGKIQVRLVGQSTARPWNDQSLPNLKVDSDEFTKGVKLDGYEHVRFNNGLVGSIFREKLAFDLFRSVGFPAPLATYAWVGSSVWGPEVAVPYTLVEVYKLSLCDRYPDEFGGGCVNMWEFFGDLGFGAFTLPESCQVKECDNGRAEDFEVAVLDTPSGPGFKEALAEWLDWDSYHRFQCMSWIVSTSDDPIHAQNNLLIAEGADGLFRYLPYSVDISLGFGFDINFPFQVPLTGGNTLSVGCQADPECWADTIATCETTISDFQDADPVAMIDEMFQALDTEGMLRSGDEGRYDNLREWLEQRVETLPDELELYRELPEQCLSPLIDCGGGLCLLPEECFGGCGVVGGPIALLGAPVANAPAAAPDADAGVDDPGVAMPVGPPIVCGPFPAPLPL